MSSQRSFTPVTMRSIHTERKKPTPMPTVTRSTVLLMWGTVSASTCRSGSAMVTAKPSIKLTMRISGRLRVLVSAVPMRLPMGVMEASAPREKSPMPTITKSVPIKKQSSRSVPTGAMVRHNSSTMTTIGSTDMADSRIFSIIFTWFAVSAALFFLLCFPLCALSIA